MFNNNKYGIISNWTRAWFLRCMEAGGRKTLECAGPIELDGSTGGAHAEGYGWNGAACRE